MPACAPTSRKCRPPWLRNRRSRTPRWFVGNAAGDAALAADAYARPRGGGHVDEPAVDVPEETAPRKAAVRLPVADVPVRVRVDGEEVEPAVPVVIEPADAAAHHRRHVGSGTAA